MTSSCLIKVTANVKTIYRFYERIQTTVSSCLPILLIPVEQGFQMNVANRGYQRVVPGLKTDYGSYAMEGSKAWGRLVRLSEKI